jgi:hypothetical protein
MATNSLLHSHLFHVRMQLLLRRSRHVVNSSCPVKRTLCVEIFSLWLVLLPLLRRIALCTPCMHRSNLLLQRGVDGPMTLQRSLLCKLRGDDYGFVHLSAAAWNRISIQDDCISCRNDGSPDSVVLKCMACDSPVMSKGCGTALRERYSTYQRSLTPPSNPSRTGARN